MTSDIGMDMVSTSPRFSTGAGYVILVAREVSGLSQRTLAIRMRTSQPTVAKLETGSRMPTVRTLMRAATAAGLELVLGLRDPDADPPLPGELADFVLPGALRFEPHDGLADFVVIREPSPFVGHATRAWAVLAARRPCPARTGSTRPSR